MADAREGEAQKRLDEELLALGTDDVGRQPLEAAGHPMSRDVGLSETGGMAAVFLGDGEVLGCQALPQQLPGPRHGDAHCPHPRAPRSTPSSLQAWTRTPWSRAQHRQDRALRGRNQAVGRGKPWQPWHPLRRPCERAMTPKCEKRVPVSSGSSPCHDCQRHLDRGGLQEEVFHHGPEACLLGKRGVRPGPVVPHRVS